MSCVQMSKPQIHLNTIMSNYLKICRLYQLLVHWLLSIVILGSANTTSTSCIILYSATTNIYYNHQYYDIPTDTIKSDSSSRRNNGIITITETSLVIYGGYKPF